MRMAAVVIIALAILYGAFWEEIEVFLKLDRETQQPGK
jgi:hypothetical protein